MKRFLIVSSLVLLTPSLVQSQEQWVKSIRTTSDWAAFPCTDYWITVACGTAKDYSDPGSLPRTVSIGDTIQYRDRDGEVHNFKVKVINFFVFDQDVDFTSEGQRYTARKGETTCSLCETTKAFRSNDYLSKIVVKGCHLLR